MPAIPPTLALTGLPPSPSPSSSSSSSSSPRTRGRRLVTTAAFGPGDLIAAFGGGDDDDDDDDDDDGPLVAIPDGAHLRSTCSRCLASSSSSSAPVRACTGCRAAAYCSAACQRADWSRGAHRGECAVFRRVLASSRDGGGGGGRDPAALPTPVRALVRLLLLLLQQQEQERRRQDRHTAVPRGSGSGSGPGSGGAMEDLEGHVGAFRGAGDGGRWRDMELQARAALHYLGRGEAGPGDVAAAVEILCKLQVNSFNMADADVGQSGLYLHPALAMVNHSCMPNAFVQFSGRRAMLRAYQAIEKGEEVEISYIECGLPRSHRQEALKSRYHFDCCCPRCRDDLDVYQVCQRYPHLELNSFSLTPDLQSLRIPPIRKFLSSDVSLQRNVEDIYPSCSTSLDGMDALEKRKELRRRWNKCQQLRQAEMFAVEPLSQVLVEAVIFLGEQGDFAAALSVACFIALQIDPYRNPMPFAAQRVKGMLMVAKILTNTAPGVAAPPADDRREAVQTKLSNILVQTDQVTVCHAVLALVIRWGPAAHSNEWEVCSEARDLLKDIEALPGREKECAMVNAFSRNPSGPDESLFFEIGVLKPIQELSRIALDVIAVEFAS